MNIEIWIVLYLLLAHFVADFICQTDAMAINKSKSNLWLTYHAATYTAILGLAATALFPLNAAWVKFVAANFVLHWGTDFVTSRITSRLWVANQRHWFFVTIGADQWLHAAALVLTYGYLK